MKRLNLAIGIQTSSKLKEDGCCCVDKTLFVARLAEQGDAFFLSHPCRFGKSLFLDTLACAFEGCRERLGTRYLIALEYSSLSCSE